MTKKELHRCPDCPRGQRKQKNGKPLLCGFVTAGTVRYCPLRKGLEECEDD